MENVVKIVFLLIAGGCFAAITWFTFIDPVLSTNQFTVMVCAAIALVAFIIGLYVWYKIQLKGKSN
jgi:uncharacterized membrane protein